MEELKLLNSPIVIPSTREILDGLPELHSHLKRRFRISVTVDGAELYHCIVSVKGLRVVAGEEHLLSRFRGWEVVSWSPHPECSGLMLNLRSPSFANIWLKTAGGADADEGYRTGTRAAPPLLGDRKGQSPASHGSFQELEDAPMTVAGPRSARPVSAQLMAPSFEPCHGNIDRPGDLAVGGGDFGVTRPGYNNDAVGQCLDAAALAEAVARALMGHGGVADGSAVAALNSAGTLLPFFQQRQDLVGPRGGRQPLHDISWQESGGGAGVAVDNEPPGRPRSTQGSANTLTFMSQPAQQAPGRASAPTRQLGEMLTQAKPCVPVLHSGSGAHLRFGNEGLRGRDGDVGLLHWDSSSGVQPRLDGAALACRAKVPGHSQSKQPAATPVPATLSYTALEDSTPLVAKRQPPQRGRRVTPTVVASPPAPATRADEPQFTAALLIPRAFVCQGIPNAMPGDQYPVVLTVNDGSRGAGAAAGVTAAEAAADAAQHYPGALVVQFDGSGVLADAHISEAISKYKGWSTIGWQVRQLDEVLGGVLWVEWQVCWPKAPPPPVMVGTAASRGGRENATEEAALAKALHLLVRQQQEIQEQLSRMQVRRSAQQHQQHQQHQQARLPQLQASPFERLAPEREEKLAWETQRKLLQEQLQSLLLQQQLHTLLQPQPLDLRDKRDLHENIHASSLLLHNQLEEPLRQEPLRRDASAERWLIQGPPDFHIRGPAAGRSVSTLRLDKAIDPVGPPGPKYGVTVEEAAQAARCDMTDVRQIESDAAATRALGCIIDRAGSSGADARGGIGPPQRGAGRPVEALALPQPATLRTASFPQPRSESQQLSKPTSELAVRAPLAAVLPADQDATVAEAAVEAAVPTTTAAVVSPPSPRSIPRQEVPLSVADGGAVVLAQRMADGVATQRTPTRSSDGAAGQDAAPAATASEVLTLTVPGGGATVSRPEEADPVVARSAPRLMSRYLTSGEIRLLFTERDSRVLCNPPCGFLLTMQMFLDGQPLGPPQEAQLCRYNSSSPRYLTSVPAQEVTSPPIPWKRLLDTTIQYRRCRSGLLQLWATRGRGGAVGAGEEGVVQLTAKAATAMPKLVSFKPAGLRRAAWLAASGGLGTAPGGADGENEAEAVTDAVRQGSGLFCDAEAGGGSPTGVRIGPLGSATLGAGAGGCATALPATITAPFPRGVAADAAQSMVRQSLALLSGTKVESEHLDPQAACQTNVSNGIHDPKQEGAGLTNQKSGYDFTCHAALANGGTGCPAGGAALGAVSAAHGDGDALGSEEMSYCTDILVACPPRSLSRYVTKAELELLVGTDVYEQLCSGNKLADVRVMFEVNGRRLPEVFLAEIERYNASSPFYLKAAGGRGVDGLPWRSVPSNATVQWRRMADNTLVLAQVSNPVRRDADPSRDPAAARAVATSRRDSRGGGSGGGVKRRGNSCAGGRAHRRRSADEDTGSEDDMLDEPYDSGDSDSTVQDARKRRRGVAGAAPALDVSQGDPWALEASNRLRALAGVAGRALMLEEEAAVAEEGGDAGAEAEGQAVDGARGRKRCATVFDEQGALGSDYTTSGPIPATVAAAAAAGGVAVGGSNPETLNGVGGSATGANTAAWALADVACLTAVAVTGGLGVVTCPSAPQHQGHAPGGASSFISRIVATNLYIGRRQLQALYGPGFKANAKSDMQLSLNGSVMPEMYHVQWKEGCHKGSFYPKGAPLGQLRGRFLQGIYWLDETRNLLVAVAWDQPPADWPVRRRRMDNTASPAGAATKPRRWLWQRQAERAKKAAQAAVAGGTAADTGAGASTDAGGSGPEHRSLGRLECTSDRGGDGRDLGRRSDTDGGCGGGSLPRSHRSDSRSPHDSHDSGESDADRCEGRPAVDATAGLMEYEAGVAVEAAAVESCREAAGAGVKDSDALGAVTAATSCRPEAALVAAAPRIPAAEQPGTLLSEVVVSWERQGSSRADMSERPHATEGAPESEDTTLMAPATAVAVAETAAAAVAVAAAAATREQEMEEAEGPRGGQPSRISCGGSDISSAVPLQSQPFSGDRTGASREAAGSNGAGHAAAGLIGARAGRQPSPAAAGAAGAAPVPVEKRRREAEDAAVDLPGQIMNVVSVSEGLAAARKKCRLQAPCAVEIQPQAQTQAHVHNAADGERDTEMAAGLRCDRLAVSSALPEERRTWFWCGVTMAAAAAEAAAAGSGGSRTSGEVCSTGDCLEGDWHGEDSPPSPLLPSPPQGRSARMRCSSLATATGAPRQHEGPESTAQQSNQPASDVPLRKQDGDALPPRLQQQEQQLQRLPAQYGQPGAVQQYGNGHDVGLRVAAALAPLLAVMQQGCLPGSEAVAGGATEAASPCGGFGAPGGGEECSETTDELVIRTMPWISMHLAQKWYPDAVFAANQPPYSIQVAVEADGVLQPERYPAHLKSYPFNNSVFLPGLPVKLVKGMIRTGWRKLADQTLVLMVRSATRSGEARVGGGLQDGDAMT